MLAKLRDLPQYKLAEGELDMRGWDVADRRHNVIGTVDSYIVDTDAEKVRYLGISTDGEIHPVPVGQVDFDESNHQVLLREGLDLRSIPQFQETDYTADREKSLYSTWFPQTTDMSYDRPEFTSANDRLQLIEERLHIGKEQVRMGEASARKTVTERPAEETVELREEHATLERTPVDRPVSGNADNLFQEQEIRMPLMGEKPVVEKEAFIKEEVGLRKETETRRETVRDTVRSENVEFVGTEPDALRDESPRGGTLRGRSNKDEPLTEKIKDKFRGL